MSKIANDGAEGLEFSGNDVLVYEEQATSENTTFISNEMSKDLGLSDNDIVIYANEEMVNVDNMITVTKDFDLSDNDVVIYADEADNIDNTTLIQK